MSFLHRVAGFSLRDRVRSSDIRERLRIELLFLHIERSQFMWFRHQAVSLGRCFGHSHPEGDPRADQRLVSRLAMGRLGIPLEELVEVARGRTICSGFCPQTQISSRKKKTYCRWAKFRKAYHEAKRKQTD